jgi:hypothetical protein
MAGSSGDMVGDRYAPESNIRHSVSCAFSWLPASAVQDFVQTTVQPYDM